MLISLLLLGNWVPSFVSILRRTALYESESAYTAAMPNWRGLLYQLVGTNDSSLGHLLEPSLLALSVGLVLAVGWTRPRLGRATSEVRFAVAVILGLMIVPHLYIHDVVIGLLPGVLLWRASSAALAVTLTARLHALRWWLGLGPVIFHVMQFWHPPLIQIGSWYLVLLLLLVFWCWNLLSVPPPVLQAESRA